MTAVRTQQNLCSFNSSMSAFHHCCYLAKISPSRTSFGRLFCVLSSKKFFFIFHFARGISQAEIQTTNKPWNHIKWLSIKKIFVVFFSIDKSPYLPCFFFLRLNLRINVETPENPYESDQKSFDLKHSSMNSKWCCFCYVFFLLLSCANLYVNQTNSHE